MEIIKKKDGCKRKVKRKKNRKKMEENKKVLDVREYSKNKKEGNVVKEREGGRKRSKTRKTQKVEELDW